MEFEFDPAKSEANRGKHGIGFEEAQALWEMWGLVKPLPFLAEPRLMRVALLGGRHWTAIYTLRGDRVRLISVRRSRESEIREYERANEGQDKYDHQP